MNQNLDALPSSSRDSHVRHRLHGVLLTGAGIFLLGTYITPGPWEKLQQETAAYGAPLSAALILFGLFILTAGRKLLQPGTTFREYYDAVVVAVGIALVIRTFLFEPFKIPSGSMIPTLLVGDYLFVQKYSYGFRVPYTTHRILMGEGPQRGDVAVFKYPEDPGKDYIKRIIGLPGDRILYVNKQLFINDQPVSYAPQGDFTYYNERDNKLEGQRFTEELPGKSHDMLIQSTPFAYPAGRFEYTVPPEHYFAMGDNRDNSNDSRIWGPVPAWRLVGRATMLFWSYDHHEASLMGKIRWGRIGSPVI
ncbi:MAG: signal peptidase I [Magnetococcales bacterium]|nr:signal peptidase I [Magnetococcales bacterium]